MLFNKENRLTYLGFDDKWFLIIGIIILSFVTDYIFANSFSKYPLAEAIKNWAISLFFSVCYWFITRVTLIYLRKRYPTIQEIIKRISYVLLLLVITILLVDYLGFKLFTYGKEVSYDFIEISPVLVPILIISVMVMAIYEAIYFYVQLKEAIRQEEQAKQAIVGAQLDALRNQAQPHFFFNSLNTLRDIIDQNSKTDAKVFVDKLADIYRFILDSGNVNLISLSDELKFARAYMHIQSERFGENLNVMWNIPEVALQKTVVPMSLQLLLENAIKHNIIARSKPLVVHVSVIQDKLKVSNVLQPKSTQLPSTKVGLINIKKRYRLIANAPVEVTNTGEEFIVTVPLLPPSNQQLTHENTNY